MKIILTCNYSPWSAYSGGGQRSTHHLANALVARGHRVTVVYTKPAWEKVSVPPDTRYEIRWAAFFGLRSARAAVARPLNAISVTREVARLIPEKIPVIVHSQGEEGASIPMLRGRYRVGIVVTPRYPRFPEALTEPRYGPVSRAWSALVDPKYTILGEALKRADRVCPTSRDSLGHVRRAFGLDAARLLVVPNGVDPAFASVERRPSAARGPVVFFGRLSRSKGVHVLCGALEKLGPRCPEVVFVGRGEEREPIRRRLKARGLARRVRFLDWMSAPDLARSLGGASMAALPSLEESFGNAMVESMAAGTPLISSEAGSIPEIVESGRTGLLVPPGDEDALAAAIQSLLSAPESAERLGRAALAHARRTYSWDETARLYEEVYTSVSLPRE